MSLIFQEIKSIPNDQYSCTQCELVPEIIDINYESGSIIIRCLNQGEKKINILNYFNDELPFLYYSAKCQFSNVDQKKYLDKNEYFIYCKKCEQICCVKCSIHHSGHKNTFIQINEKINICEKHFKKYVKFCTQCKKNFCSHKECKCKHDLIEIKMPDNKDLKEIKDKRNSLFKQKEVQELLIKLLDTLIETYEKHPANYYNNININNVSKRLREINNMKKYEINREEIINKIDNLEKKILNLKIGNEELEFLSPIEFNSLKEINLSSNKISDLETFKNLEEIDLNANQISNKEPLKNFKSKKIKRIDLSYNDIKNKDKLIKNKEKNAFPHIQDIKLDDNNIMKDIEKIKNLIKGENIKESNIIDNSEKK